MNIRVKAGATGGYGLWDITLHTHPILNVEVKGKWTYVTTMDEKTFKTKAQPNWHYKPGNPLFLAKKVGGKKVYASWPFPSYDDDMVVDIEP